MKIKLSLIFLLFGLLLGPQISFAQDSDGDGTANNLDQDEDNDGVPDELDGCSTIDVANTIGIGSPIINNATYSIEETDITYTTNNATAFYGYVAGNQGNSIRTQGPGLSNAELQMSFSTPIQNLTFKITDFDDNEEITIEAYNQFNTLINLNATNVPFLGSNPTRSGNTIETPGSFGNCEGDDEAADGSCAAYLYFSGQVSRIVFTVSIAANSSLRITELNYCLIDTDKDGVLDFKDIDSDNDGIPDIVEAGGVDTDGDGFVDNISDNNNNGIPDIYDFQCTNGATGTGYADTVGNDTVNTLNASDALNAGDQTYAAIQGTGVLELRMSAIIPAGNNIVIRHRRNGGTGPISFTIERSINGNTYFNSQTFTTSFNNSYEVLSYDLIGANTRWIKITNLSPNVPLQIDYAKYNFGANSNCSGILGQQILNLNTDTDNLTNAQDLDSDNDGLYDVIEAGQVDLDNNAMADNFVDTDGDGYNDNFDGDVGNDGIAENSAAAIILTGIDTSSNGVPNSYLDANVDNSGFPNPYDIDSDDDGIPDNVEAQPTVGYVIPNVAVNPTNGLNLAYLTGLTAVDTDGDGIPDYQDTNSDGDANLDIEENGDVNVLSGVDSDRDGLDNNFDSITATFDTNDEVTTGTQAELTVIFGDADGDLAIGGDLDYRDLFDINPPSSGSLDFDGIDDFVEVPVSLINTLDLFSMSFWIKPVTLPVGNDSHFIIGQKDVFEILLENDVLGDPKMVFRHFYGVGSSQSTSVDIDSQNWRHVKVRVTYTASVDSPFGNMSISINGGTFNTVAGDAGAMGFNGFRVPNANPLRMGSKSDTQPATGENYNGWLDEVRIFNRNLSSFENESMIFQEIENDNGNIRGTVIDQDIEGLFFHDIITDTGDIDISTGTIPWLELVAYYPMTNIIDGKIVDESLSTNDGFLNNITSVLPQTAPMPYETILDGDWTEESTWLHGDVWDIESSPNYRGSIVRINNAVETSTSHREWAMFIDDSQSLKVFGDNFVQNVWYFELNGTLDLQDDSQLIQTGVSNLVTSNMGKILRRQEGNSNVFWYNYWSSPVGALNATSLIDDNDTVNNPNNTPFSASMLEQGSNGANVQFTTALSPTLTDPVTVSTRWLYTYQNGLTYNDWLPINQNTAITQGFGYTQKGTAASGLEQQYIFEGKPNNGTILIAADDVEGDSGNESQQNVTLTTLLVGNPYPSALDARQFIEDNESVIQGTLLLWEQWAGISHNLAAYEGGYGYINSMATERAYQHPDIPIAGQTQTQGIKTPSFYIPVSQGFFVEAINDGNIEFNNGQRVFILEADADVNDPEEGSVFFDPSNATDGDKPQEVTTNKDTQDEEDTLQLIRLEFAVSNGATRRFVLGFDHNTTDGFDYGYDGGLISDIQEEDLTSLFNGKPYVLQAFSAITPEKIIDLNLVASGTHTYSLDIVQLKNIDDTQEIYLKDHQENITWNLRQGPYSFSALAGEDPDRFDIVFQDDTLSNDEFQTNNLLIYVNNTQEKLFIKGLQEQVKTLTITNILGQRITRYIAPEIDSLENGLDVSNLSTGVYVINLTTMDAKQITKKVVIE